jgi:hypothetical protein
VGGVDRDGVGRPTCPRHPGWFSNGVQRGVTARHQTALRGQAAFPSRKATVAVGRRRLRNLSVPTCRRSKKASSTWAAVQDRPGREESRPPSAGKRLPRAASAQLGYARWSGRIGRAIASSALGRSKNRSPAQGQSKRRGVGRVPQGDEEGSRSQKKRRPGAVAVVPQFGRLAPDAGPVNASTHQGPFMSFLPEEFLDSLLAENVLPSFPS